MALPPQTTSALTAYDLVPQFIDQSFWSELDLRRGAKRRCQATTKESKYTLQCKNPLNRMRDVPGQIAHLKQLDPRTSAVESCEVMEEIIHSLLCWQHRDAAKRAARSYFRRRIRPDGENTCPANLMVPATSHNRASAPRHYGTRSDPIARETIRQESTHLTAQSTFEPYKSRPRQGGTVAEIIRRQLQGFRDAKPGICYAYIDPSCPGYRKIGRTTRNAQVRLAEWKSQCKATIALEIVTQTEVPCVFQMERLIAAELRPHRYWKVCAQCPRRHTEWFQVSEAFAALVMAKWYKFFAAEPYVPSPFARGEWTLRVEYQNDAFLDFLCTPLPLDEARSPGEVMAEVDAAMKAVSAPQVPAPVQASPVQSASVNQPEQLFYILLVILYFAAAAQQGIAATAEAMPASGAQFSHLSTSSRSTPSRSASVVAASA